MTFFYGENSRQYCHKTIEIWFPNILLRLLRVIFTKGLPRLTGCDTKLNNIYICSPGPIPIPSSSSLHVEVSLCKLLLAVPLVECE